MTDSHSTEPALTVDAAVPTRKAHGTEVTAEEPHKRTTARPVEARSGSFFARIPTFQAIYQVPAFRWYLLSMSGNWSAMQMQNVARGFLTYEITGSFAVLGTVELANTAPRLVFALTGGVVADRRSRRAITQIGQGISAVISAVLAALLFAGMLRFEHLVIAAITRAS